MSDETRWAHLLIKSWADATDPPAFVGEVASLLAYTEKLESRLSPDREAPKDPTDPLPPLNGTPRCCDMDIAGSAWCGACCDGAGRCVGGEDK